MNARGVAEAKELFAEACQSGNVTEALKKLARAAVANRTQWGIDEDKVDYLVQSRELDEVARVYGVTIGKLIEKNKHPSLVRARWVAMLALHFGGLSYPEIGRRLGRDHTTVLHGLRMAKKDGVLSGMARQIADMVASGGQVAA